MSSHSVITLVLALVIFSGLVNADEPDFSQWFDYEEAQQYSETYNRPLMLYFFSKTCPYCDKMEMNVLGVPSVNKLLVDNFVVTSINIYEEDHLTTNHQAKGTPSFIFLSHQDDQLIELGRLVGSRPRKQFLTELKDFCLSHYSKEEGSGNCG